MESLPFTMNFIPSSSAASVALLGILAAVLYKLFFVKPAELDFDGWVVPLAQGFGGHPINASAPLTGKTIAVTGATNGIGLSLTRTLSKLGATVIAIGRSEQKLQALKDEGLSVLTFQADLSDLASVSKLAEKLNESLERIDVLVNNAGIHDGYSPSVLLGSNPRTAKNLDLDLVFVTNYLSHYLLTNKLMDLLKKSENPRIVQTSSSYHWAVDGSDLVSVNGDVPKAARPGGSTGYYFFRSQRSYANSKLAQILHARMLQQVHPEVRAVSVCPAWVGTQIAGVSGTAAFWAIQQFGYQANGWGIASILYAVLDNRKDETPPDYYSNTKVFEHFRKPFNALPSWSYKMGLRDVVTMVMANFSMIGQHFYTTVYTTKSSPESYDMKTAQSLYDWSAKAVADY